MERSNSRVTPREAALKLRIRLDAVYALIWAGRLPALKLDGRWLIPVSAVEERLNKRNLLRKQRAL